MKKNRQTVTANNSFQYCIGRLFYGMLNCVSGVGQSVHLVVNSNPNYKKVPTARVLASPSEAAKEDNA